jgi:hypothetical protein
MKNLIKVFGIIALVAVIVFSMAACGGDDGGGGGTGGGGTFTLTDIPAKYNGKYAWLVGDTLRGADKVSPYSYRADKNTRISNGKVSIPMWDLSGKRYFGNDTITELIVLICEEIDSYSGTPIYFYSVTFSNGNVTKSYNDADTRGGDSGTGGNNPQTATYTGATGGTTYTLKITENTARYAAQNGDAYELTAGSKKSTGTVSGVSGGILTLKPTNKTTTFTATVSGSSLTALNGTITWTDSTTATAPGAFSGGTNPGTGDGSLTWTTVDITSIFDRYNIYIEAIAYGKDKFVVVGDIIATSTDGRTWSAVTTNAFDYNSGDKARIYAIAHDGNSKFVAGGEFGKMAYSTDGVNWTATDSKFGDRDNSICAIAYGNNKFVAGGENGKIATSTDGVTWTAVNTGSIFDYLYDGSTYKVGIGAIAYGNNKFVAVGDEGKIATSTDGVTWTAVNTGSIFDYVDDLFGPSKAAIIAIAYGNGKFVAGGEESKIAVSSDGVSWTAVTTTAFDYHPIYSGETISTGFRRIAFGDGKFVAGHGGTMATSTDGATWTPIPTPTSFNRLWAIAYGNGKFVAGSDYGYMAYSTGN